MKVENCQPASPMISKDNADKKVCEKISVALTLITFIGSLAAAGYFFASHHSTLGGICSSFSALGILVFFVVRNSSQEALIKREMSQSSETSDLSNPTEVKEYSLSLEEIPKYSLEVIYQLCGEFKSYHYQAMRDGQKLAFDFNRIHESKRKWAFESIFDCSGVARSDAARLLPKLPLSKVYACSSLFSEQHWQLIGEEHSLSFDFEKIVGQSRKKVFNLIFCCRSSDRSSRAEILLSKLSLEKIYEQVSYFSKEHWRVLDEKHILVFDFLKIEEEKRQKVFDKMFNFTVKGCTLRASILFPKMSLDQLYPLFPFFGEFDWECLGSAHILKLDFSKLEEDMLKEIMKVCTERASTLYPKMSLDQLYFLFPFFSDLDWKCLEDEQILNLDFSKLEEDILKKAVPKCFSTDTFFKTSAAERLLPRLQRDQIAVIKPFLSDEARRYLQNGAVEI